MDNNTNNNENNNENNIFRKEVVKKFNKPDDLTDYLKVLSPKIWIILVAIIVLMIGVTIWGYFAYYVGK